MSRPIILPLYDFFAFIVCLCVCVCVGREAAMLSHRLLPDWQSQLGFGLPLVSEHITVTRTLMIKDVCLRVRVDFD